MTIRQNFIWISLVMILKKGKCFAGALKFSAISAGVDHSCALTTDSILYCWGANHYGQLGDGSTTDALIPIKVANQP